MKKLLPLLLLAGMPASYADINHSIQNVVSVSTLGASSTSNRVGTTFSASGTNVTPTANETAGSIGTLDLTDAQITNGIPTIDSTTTYAVTQAGDAWSVSESFIQGDSIPTSFLATTVTNGAVPALPIFGDTTTFAGGDIGTTAMTMDSGGAMTVNLSATGPGVTAQMSNTIKLEID
tara:strand:- start:9 stop:539 length:531 start_codon:yes stop_codon:yes gene_type:complete